MPVKKRKRKIKKKNESGFSLFWVSLIFFVSTAYIIFIWLAWGISLFFNSPEINIVRIGNGDVIYATDKTEYVLGEKIKLSLINNLSESIFLAPCRYFSDFERKISSAPNDKNTEWQPINLLSDSYCESYAFDGGGDSFNRVKKTTDQYVSAADFGVGTYRGMSMIYLRCGKPDIAACRGSLQVYSNEFVIKENPADTLVKTDLSSNKPHFLAQ